jgi:hypothetical protein
VAAAGNDVDPTVAAEQRKIEMAAIDPVLHGVEDKQACIAVRCFADVRTSIRQAFNALDPQHRAHLLGGLRQLFHDIKGWDWPRPLPEQSAPAADDLSIPPFLDRRRGAP